MKFWVSAALSSDIGSANGFPCGTTAGRPSKKLFIKRTKFDRMDVPLMCFLFASNSNGGDIL